MRRAFLVPLLSLVAASGCSDSSTAPGLDAAAAAVDASTSCEAAAGVRVTLTTDDDVALIADLSTTGTIGAPGVLLLHMIPPQNSLANYPSGFIEELTAAGFQVLNINRRGAPGSEGSAADAYQGDKGRLDARAGHDFLTRHACAVPGGAIAVVGASNGTTTANDFAVLAAGAPELDSPSALVFLSGGPYTENQNPIADHLDALAPIPMYFAYPSAEAAWNQGIESIAPEAWQFVEYSPGAHGTNLFAASDAVASDVVEFLAAATK